MKRLAIIAFVPLLVSCGPTTPNIDSGALAVAMAKVRGFTVQICNFIPDDSSLTQILTASNPIVEGAYRIAQAICAQVTETIPPLNPAQMGQERLGDGRQCPMVNGVCIEGRFIEKEKGTPQ